MTALLEVDGLVKHFVAARSVFGRPTAHVKAVDGVSFTVEAGRTLALVGESSGSSFGCVADVHGRFVLLSAVTAQRGAAGIALRIGLDRRLGIAVTQWWNR